MHIDIDKDTKSIGFSFDGGRSRWILNSRMQFNFWKERINPQPSIHPEITRAPRRIRNSKGKFTLIWKIFSFEKSDNKSMQNFDG